jgi:DNA-binding MarR family transcriptional regulator
MLGRMIADDDFVAELGLPFIAHRFRRVAEAFLHGYSAWLPQAGVVAPARSLSTLLLVCECGPIGITEIAARLRLSHPLIIRLTRDLEGEGLLKLSEDPADGRRRVAVLTRKGKQQVRAIQVATRVTATAFQTVSEEVGTDLLSLVERLEAALTSASFQSRLRTAAHLLAEKEPT